MSNKGIWLPTSSNDQRGGDVTGTQMGDKRALDVYGVPSAIKTDSSDANTTYVGFAQPGSVASSAVWRIMKVVCSSNLIDVTYADGNLNFDKVWDDRTFLTYE
jgi:hypothetical protein